MMRWIKEWFAEEPNEDEMYKYVDWDKINSFEDYKKVFRIPVKLSHKYIAIQGIEQYVKESEL